MSIGTASLSEGSRCEKCGGQAINYRNRALFPSYADVHRHLLERDGPDCFWCGLPVWMDSPTMNDSIAASSDHLVPVAQRGCNHLANLRLTHHYCNGRRGLERRYLPEKDKGWRTKVVGRMIEKGFTVPMKYVRLWQSDTADEFLARQVEVQAGMKDASEHLTRIKSRGIVTPNLSGGKQ